MDVSLLLNDLNDPQRQAVTAAEQNTLVLAGAGSGKTRVLVHRIAWLVEVMEVSPWSIMAVTFTNKAAKEMRGRLAGLLDIRTDHMWVGTFHGLAHRILRRHWQEAGLQQQFQILDSDDQLSLLKRLLKDLQIDEDVWPARALQGFINHCKDEGLRPSHIQTDGSKKSQLQAAVYKAYQQTCERAGLVDFGELLLACYELWDKNPDLCQHYQQRFKHFLVDEFQDTNTIQYLWLKKMAGKHSKVMAVGDDDQSIYSWRGAKIENIQAFDKDFEKVQTIRLEQNYRSTANILKAANSLIDHNQGRMGKNLWTDGKQGDLIALYAAFNEMDEARFVVQQINQWQTEGGLRAECAILYRSNAQSRVLEDALLRESVPYRIYGGKRFYDRLEIRNALAYLRLINNRYDDAALERVINVPTRGVGASTVEALRQQARDEGCSMWEASQQLLKHKQLSGRAHNAVQGFISLIDNLASDTQAAELHDLVDHVIKHTGLIEHHLKEKGEKAQTRIENLKELVSAAKGFAINWSPASNSEDPDAELDASQTSPLATMLEQASLDAGEQQADEYEDSVQLMTLHAAKGLEFARVFLTGLEEGLFPNKMSVEQDNRLEEERRLCYVGITRAMEKLTISYAESRRLYGQETYNRPSRFISELAVDTLEEVRLKSSVRRPLASHAYGASTSNEPYAGNTPNRWRQQSATNEPNFKLGQAVKHPIFGVGTITNAEGTGPQARVQVQFEQAGSKWLVLSYAKLEAVLG